MKKILFIVRSCASLGGVERVTRELVSSLSREYAVTVVTALPEKPFPEGEAVCRNLPDATDFNSVVNLDFLEKLIREEACGIVVNQGCVSLIYRRFSPEDPQRFLHVLHGCPSWFHVRDRQMAFQPLSAGWKPLCRTLACRFIPFYARHRVNREWRNMMRSKGALVVLDASYREELLQLKGAEKCRIEVIPNLIEEDYHTTCKKKQVLFAGRFTRADKHLERLLRIWKRVERVRTDWELQLVGDGPDRSRLERLSKRLGLKHAVFLGERPESSLYGNASILCLTSSYEGMSRSLMEAQRSGVIPVAFDINGGMRALIEHNVTGLLVKPFREREYARELLCLMDDTLRRERISDNARRFSKCFFPGRILPRWKQLFDTL